MLLVVVVVVVVAVVIIIVAVVGPTGVQSVLFVYKTHVVETCRIVRWLFS